MAAVASGRPRPGAGGNSRVWPASATAATTAAQRVVVDADQLGRVFALVAPVGEDERYGLAHEPEPGRGEHRLA